MGTYLELRWCEVGVGYQGRLKFSTSTKKSYDKANVARFFNPIVATKNTEKLLLKIGDNGEDVEHFIRKAFKCVHVSFQSTSSFNIIIVNALNDCKMSSMIRAREAFGNRRYWGI